MSLCVAGYGLVTPIGSDPREHVLWPRAGVGCNAATAFFGEDDKPIWVSHCPWLGAELVVGERLAALATSAARSALGSLADGRLGAALGLRLCLPSPRAGMTEADIARVTLALRASGSAPVVHEGAAGFFAALRAASEEIEAGARQAILVVAVDSFVSIDFVRTLSTEPAPEWTVEAPPPSEGAAAVLLTSASDAQRLGLGALGWIHYADVRPGRGSDDDDDAPDGAALTALLGSAPDVGAILRAYGPDRVDELRQMELGLALARQSKRLHSSFTRACIEAKSGLLGAASGAASVVAGLSAERLGVHIPVGATTPSEEAPTGPFVAWAMSRDGVRGLCLATAQVSTASVPRSTDPLTQRVLSRALERMAFKGELEPSTRAPSAPPAGGVATDGPAPRLNPFAAAPQAAEVVVARRVAAATETMALLAEHRVIRPMALRLSREERLLALVDAVFASGTSTVADTLAWFEHVRADGAPWTVWPALTVLGVVDGELAFARLCALVESTSPESAVSVAIMAEALEALPAHRGEQAARALRGSHHPIALATAIETLSRHAPSELEVSTAELHHASAVVVASAVRALVRHPDGSKRLAEVRRLLAHPEPQVVWEVARALSRWGAPDAIEAIRAGGAVVRALGERAADLVAMAGAEQDLESLETIGSRVPRMSAAFVRAVGRLGSPLAWSFLVHALGEREVRDAALDALTAIFGPAVTGRDALEPASWRAAITSAGLDGALRYRRGEPWTPAVALGACTSGELPRCEVEHLLDDVAARTGMHTDAALSRWGEEPDRSLARVASELSAKARWRPGSWLAN